MYYFHISNAYYVRVPVNVILRCVLAFTFVVSEERETK